MAGINPIFTSSPLLKPNSKPIVIDWELLQDIEYQLKYYEALSMEIYSPVFTKALEAIDGKEVIIEGFVIPFEESGDRHQRGDPRGARGGRGPGA